MVETVGFAGGIFVLWNSKNVTFTTISKSNQMINGVVQVSSSSIFFYFSAIYASPRFKFRKWAWKELCDFANSFTGPWLAVGDFNEIISRTEKFGGTPPKTHKMRAFLECIQNCSLIDAGFAGQRFTWTNRGKIIRFLNALIEPFIMLIGSPYTQILMLCTSPV